MATARGIAWLRSTLAGRRPAVAGSRTTPDGNALRVRLCRMFVCAECGASQPVPGRCIADGTELSPVGDDMLLGQAIGAYRIARLLGVGGMGRVYKGVHPQIGSRVAIKVLSRECSDRRDLVDRFFAEAKAVNLIRHESIVNVLDLSTLPDGRPYIVMEYLDGAPLAAIVEQAQRGGTPLPIGGLARLVAEVLDALGAAHGKGIVHRDLKPDNIFVTPAGRAKVLDFGIAKLQRAELGGSATHTGSLLGTPHYMSPEQAAGRAVDHRADLYAIGVILFECATLHKPFVADSLFELLRKHIETPPPSPRAIRRDMPQALEHIIYTALAKLPEQRFASAHAMSMAMQHATAGLPSEQWMPIVPTSASRGPSGGWHPTPPASWASAHRSSGSGSGGPSVATGPTQTAGQVTARGRGASKGVWIALGTVALVGGGITAAVLASRSDAPPAPRAVVGSASAVQGDPWGDPGAAGGTPTAAPTGDATAGRAAPDGTSTAAPGSSEVTPGPAQTPTPPAAGARVAADGGDLDEATTAVMDDALGQMFDSLDPSARAMLPPELTAALKKHGKWSKIPKAERMKLLAKLGGSTMALTPQAAHAAAAALDPAAPRGPSATAQAPRGSAPPPVPRPRDPTALAATPPPPARHVPGLGADGWVVARTFKPPGAYDPKRLSVEKYLPFAIAEAKKLVPDAVLFRIDADGVYPDGHADITLAGNGSLDFRFISPSRTKGDPTLPVGAKQEYKCMFRVMLNQEGAWSAPLSGWECKEPLLGPPKCTTKQIWKKALDKGAPENAIAGLGYRGSSGKARWYFSIEGTKHSHVFDDDCR
jgi:serine/threonine protein kinase